MLGLAIKGLIGLALISLGWIGGSLYPAPEQWVALVKGRADPIISRLDVSPAGLARLRASLSPQRFARATHEAAILAASTGDAIRVERTPGAVLDEHADAVAAEQGHIAPLRFGGAIFEDTLRLCPGMAVSNAPTADEQNRVRGYSRFISVNGDTLAVNPTHGACLAAGVGMRGGHMHRGLDFYSRDGGPIFAASDGTVIEQLYRDDYGNMLLIDDGAGVYTRYAHLSSFAPNITVGTHVDAGQQIGLMGNTASYSIPVHLHFELLLGDYHNPRQSLGLTPRSPFDFFGSSSSSAAPRLQGEGVTSASAVQRQPSSVVPSQLTRDDASGAFCPSGPITDATAVTIRHGDTLFAIARACYGNADAWPQVVNCNHFLVERNRGGVSPLNGGDLLYVGDRVALPAPGGQCPVSVVGPQTPAAPWPVAASALAAQPAASSARPHGAVDEETLNQYRAWISEARRTHPYADSEERMYEVMMCESRGRAGMVNPAGPYTGLFQYGSGTWSGAWNLYRDQSVLDPRAQIFATALAWQRHMQGQWGCYANGH
jgi:murein DD-endopeptidase MepM/ murein hydrolase activator NlpD